MTAAAPLCTRDAPARAGIGLRPVHYRDMQSRRPPLAFLEVHSENYFGAGGPPHAHLERLRADYSLSLHGVGMSLGSTDPLDRVYLDRLKNLIARYQPVRVSDHLCWTSVNGVHAHELLPLPYTDEVVRHLAARIRQAQDILGLRLLVENATSYVEFAASHMPEWEFVRAVVVEADCDLLLDVNNIYVNAINLGFDPLTYIEAMPAERVKEIHLAGHDRDTRLDCLVDTHGTAVTEPVWRLYRQTIARIGPRPTLIEWDTDIPPLDVLLDAASRADAILEADHHARRIAA